MDNDHVQRSIEHFERALAQDDPAFMKRFRAVYRTEVCAVITVFVLLATGAVLLTVGVATASWPAWMAGVVSFLASFAVDEHHKHALRRTR